MALLRLSSYAQERIEAKILATYNPLITAARKELAADWGDRAYDSVISSSGAIDHIHTLPEGWFKKSKTVHITFLSGDKEYVSISVKLSEPQPIPHSWFTPGSKKEKDRLFILTDKKLVEEILTCVDKVKTLRAQKNDMVQTTRALFKTANTVQELLACTPEIAHLIPEDMLRECNKNKLPSTPKKLRDDFTAALTKLKLQE